MAITSYISATIERICTIGTVDTVRKSNNDGWTIVWRNGTREVLLDESSVPGRKIALYNALRTPSVIGQIKKLEGEAQSRAALLAIAQHDAETAHLLGIVRETPEPDYPHLDEFAPTDDDRRVAAIAAQG